MNKAEVRARIDAIGIVPAIRVYSAEDARFAAEAVSQGGIPIVEITMTVPGALHVIADLVQHAPGMLVGAGSVLDTETAHACLAAGASFLTTDGLDLKIVEYAVKQNIVVFPGAFTPTEVLTAWKAGSDLVKVVPCAHAGGDTYIKALKAPFPQIPMIAAGGVNQQTATNFILAGALALGVGTALIPRESIKLRQADRIRELARRFVGFVEAGRSDLAARKEGITTGD
ncbi:MAG TPA: bifunctional 4-hydroxy-2-oxoglutarate aldolase/2-dehydro-3-deoxy-phosphogluconate aldolase [Candidatus Acidoferrales bacterium]|nr:bifunctional 4-hydroxy-2-oxoglutarate aldolase/2-dehydro-3-deoxy-phosphogluconate aldolase [Candidatus Acidoferrales bacterium]